jgi:uroporphyrinogen-III decarboxylase
MKISSPYANSTFLSQESYAEWIVPSEGPIAKAVRDEGGFVYTHTCGAITDRLELMAEAGINGIETLDPPPLGTIDIADAKERLKGKMFIIGNIDPVNVLLRMNKEDARNDVKRVFDIGRKGGEFILSTACSVAPPTPRENVELLAECVHSHPAHD